MIERRTLTKSDLEWMNVPPEFWRARFDQVPESVRAVVERYVRRLPEMIERPTGLYLSGLAGVGKTGTAVVIAKEARSVGFPVYFAPVWELREDIKNRATTDGVTGVLARCREVDLLVLDGLRAEDAEAHFFGAREIEDLLSARAGRRRPTFLTSRVRLAELRAKGLGGAVSALEGTCVEVPVVGPNLRSAQNKQLVADLFGPEPGKKE